MNHFGGYNYNAVQPSPLPSSKTSEMLLTFCRKRAHKSPALPRALRHVPGVASARTAAGPVPAHFPNSLLHWTIHIEG